MRHCGAGSRDGSVGKLLVQHAQEPEHSGIYDKRWTSSEHRRVTVTSSVKREQNEESVLNRCLHRPPDRFRVSMRVCAREKHALSARNTRKENRHGHLFNHLAVRPERLPPYSWCPPPEHLHPTRVPRILPAQATGLSAALYASWFSCMGVTRTPVEKTNCSTREKGRTCMSGRSQNCRSERCVLFFVLAMSFSASHAAIHYNGYESRAYTR